MACRVRDYRAAPSRRNRADSGALAAAPAVHSVAADGRLRVRSASRPLHSQSLSLVGTLSDSSSPSLEGDRVSLQLWGDIILEHLHHALHNIDTSCIWGFDQLPNLPLAAKQVLGDYQQKGIFDHKNKRPER